MFYPRVKWTQKEATINVHGKDKMHKRLFSCMVERERTWTSIPFCRYQSPSKHHTKKMQGLMEFASPNLPCLCSLPIHVPEATDRTGGTLQSNVSCQMSRSLNQKQMSVSKGDTLHLPKVPTPAHLYQSDIQVLQSCTQPKTMMSSWGLTVSSTSAGGTQILMREERSCDTGGQTYGLSYIFSTAATTGFLLKNVHLKGKNHWSLFSLASTL